MDNFGLDDIANKYSNLLSGDITNIIALDNNTEDDKKALINAINGLKAETIRILYTMATGKLGAIDFELNYDSLAEDRLPVNVKNSDKNISLTITGDSIYTVLKHSHKQAIEQWKKIVGIERGLVSWFFGKSKGFPATISQTGLNNQIVNSVNSPLIYWVQYLLVVLNNKNIKIQALCDLTKSLSNTVAEINDIENECKVIENFLSPSLAQHLLTISIKNYIYPFKLVAVLVDYIMQEDAKNKKPISVDTILDQELILELENYRKAKNDKTDN
ncbi:MAG: hypothetical protein QXL94_00830 [Candidatus Parvarchaeum sp.]